MPNLKDCVSMFEYLDEFVKIKLKETSDPLFGWLYTIDPVSNRYFIFIYISTCIFHKPSIGSSTWYVSDISLC